MKRLDKLVWTAMSVMVLAIWANALIVGAACSKIEAGLQESALAESDVNVYWVTSDDEGVTLGFGETEQACRTYFVPADLAAELAVDMLREFGQTDTQVEMLAQYDM